MENVNLRKVDLNFHRKLKTISTDEERWGRFEEYFNWMESQVKENVKDADYFYMVILLNACKFMKDSSLKAKDISRKWNGGLVRSTYDFCKWARENGDNQPKECILKLGVLLNEIDKESDFTTKVYCFSVLQQNKHINLAKEATKFGEEESEDLELKSDSNDAFREIRFRYIPDGNNLSNVELYTFDEAKVNRIPYWLLQWPRETGRQCTFLSKEDVVKAGLEPYEVEWTPSYDKVNSKFNLDIIDGEALLNDKITLPATNVG